MPHPTTPPGVPLALEVAVERSSGALHLRYVVRGDPARLRIPAAAASPRQRHLLWQHTCFEAFVTRTPGGPYHELNLSPSGDWAAYAFVSYRDGAPLPDDALAPSIRTHAVVDGLALDARIELAVLGPDLAAAPLAIALSGVVEEADGRISYWALHHPAEKADFHHAGGFLLRLDPPNERSGRETA